MKRLIIAAFLLLSFNGVSQQESQEYFASFIVDSIPSIQDYRNIDIEMRSIEGVILSRMDIPTNRYYVRYTTTEMHDEMWFRTKFLEMGNYSIHCLQFGIKGVQTFVPMTRDTCDELN